MVIESYDLIAPDDEPTRFFFVSEGIKGAVVKAVFITPIGNGTWNLGFCDYYDGRYDDTAVTNNNDVSKVLGTVAKAALAFSEKYPERTLVIRPVDDRRKRLYNVVFTRRQAEIESLFDVYAKRKNRWQHFAPGFDYDGFMLIRKKPYF